MKKETKAKIKEIMNGGSLVAGVALSIAALIVLANVGNIGDIHDNNKPIIENAEEDRIWQDFKMPLVTANDPGAGAYGWLNLSVVKFDHFDYSANLTGNASTLCYETVNNSHAGTVEIDIYDFEIAMQFRLNDTFRATNGTWMLSWLKVYCNSSALGISTVQCDLFNVTSSDNWLYGYAVVDNSTGYHIQDGLNVTSCKFNARAYLP